MGYTHYWQGTKFSIHEKDMDDALQAISKLAADPDVQLILAGPRGEGDPIFTQEQVAFNGKFDDSHEAFIIDNGWRGEFGCTKTIRKPYDYIVVACLIILKHYLGASVRVSSDGTKEDWQEGLESVHRVCGEEFKIKFD